MNGFEEPRWYLYSETDAGQSWLDREKEVVRCRDCELFATDGRWGVCTQFDFETTEENMRDGFCAWGVRREK